MPWHARHCLDELGVQIADLRASVARARHVARMLANLLLLPFLRHGQRGEVAACLAPRSVGPAILPRLFWAVCFGF